MTCGSDCVFPPSGAGWSHCSTCHQVFNSDVAFDMHRTGKFENPDNPRRCMTFEEMAEKGMALNSRGRWVTSLKTEDALSAVRATP